MKDHLFVEVVKVMDGAFVNPQPHTERMFRTTDKFFSKPLVVELTNIFIPTDYCTGIVKCRIVYGSEIVSIEFEPYQMRDIQSLAVIESNTIDYNYKYLNRELINHLSELRGNCDDILIVKNSLVTDTSYSNVLFKDFDSRLYTPTSTLLAGTKRKQLLDAGIIYEREIHMSQIKSYLGVYLINAMIDIEDNIFVGVDSILY